MGRTLLVLCAAMSVSAAAITAGAALAAAPAYVAAAVADASRPQADKDLDASRKPAELMAFAGVKPGDKVIDIFPGGGYTTRLFSKIVGDKGHVYAVAPPAMAERMKKVAEDPNFKNISFAGQPMDAITAPEKVDLVWTSQNYHDFAMPMSPLGMVDIAKLNKAIYDALKPGGVYMITDHAASPGTSLADTQKLHRIDPAIVKQQVTAAGFKLEGESDLLKVAEDPHTAPVFDGAVRGKTDKFVLRFRKPK
ncbi:MAG: methyltransferase domain-containing protein [Caulobacteraceae bacterium]